ncbi:hypothetical protein ABT095_10795 [Kitasatospora sp. NPDC002227]|uniref:hypothetical protein n=1 Tax=Kitasatospora sp. NPDC002227 TaxID=3154773 RepID=UPI003320A35B
MITSGVLVIAALAALVASPDPALARSVGVAAVLVCVGLGVLLRQRDRAERAAAELAATRRLRDEERFEEQLAEAEYAAEVAEERAARFGRRLTAEKSRLAKAETEIARLLKERAVMVAAQALKDAEAARKALAAARPKHPVTAAAYVRAGSVLRRLEREAERAEQLRESAANAGHAELELRPAAKLVPVSAAAEQAGAPTGAAALAPVPATGVPAAGVAVEPVTHEPATEPVERQAPLLRPVLTAAVEPLRAVPAATAVVPAERQRPRPQAVPAGRTFSFFGQRPGAQARPAVPAPAGDLADVLGDEVLAETARLAEPAEPVAVAPSAEVTQVVDLSAEDDTVGLEVSELRANHR